MEAANASYRPSRAYGIVCLGRVGIYYLLTIVCVRRGARQTTPALSLFLSLAVSDACERVGEPARCESAYLDLYLQKLCRAPDPYRRRMNAAAFENWNVAARDRFILYSSVLHIFLSAWLDRGMTRGREKEGRPALPESEIYFGLFSLPTHTHAHKFVALARSDVIPARARARAPTYAVDFISEFICLFCRVTYL